MKELTTIVLLVFGLSLTANADIWKWVDAHGNVHYGDTPARAEALNAERVRYTPSNQNTSKPSDSRTVTSWGSDTDTGESAEEERAQSYYCEQARSIYQSYVDAPRLYRTTEDGEREYLSDQEKAATLADAEVSVSEWCK